MIATFFLIAAEAMTFTADRIATDNVTKTLAATGHVVATYAPLTVRGEYLTREADGTLHFRGPACATTCTNAVGHTHWNVSGDVEYQADDHVLLKDMVLSFCEVPVFWLPYMYYPILKDCGFSCMPGYMGRWGAFLLTKYAYHLLGDPEHGGDTLWLTGATRFDMRYRQGLAVGEDLSWNLGDFGRGGFNAYYAWDQDAENHGGYARSDYTDQYHSYNWGSPVDEHRYAFSFRHKVEPTERDAVALRASVLSDSYFRDDFQRRTMFNWQSQWLGYDNSGVFWDHQENSWAIGGEVSGRLNEFYGMTDRLPEFYVDVNPQPVFGWPVNYESVNRIGWLRRNPAEYGMGDSSNPYCFNPGTWADYDAFRVDTYHRLTAPFKVAWDTLSVVPRIAFRGTGWSDSGRDNLTGWGGSESSGEAFRPILEEGMTFAGRGTGWVSETWRHMVEPYFDVLCQEAWMSGSANRPYVFDSIDASLAWEDQFAGRSRNLPYSYYGVTPGVRNAWDRADERGNLRQIVDFDVYGAVQFGSTSFDGVDDAHKLAEVCKPNYGKTGCYVAPGVRVRWTPADDLSLLARAEYDADNNTIASGDAGLRQKVSPTFSYNVNYAVRDYRWWDYSSTPYDPALMTSDDLNYMKAHMIRAGLENQPFDWFAWGPSIRWDLRENELDTIGVWFDYLTDCLGFRFMVDYQNSYTRIDGYERDDDWSFGFYIYLRAFGADSANVFSN